MAKTQTEEQSSLVGILNRIQAWIVAADQKISVVTAIETLICGFLFVELKSWIQNPITSMTVRVMLHASAAVLAIGLGYSVLALFPQLKKKKHRRSPGQSAMFFGHIQQLPLEEYRQKLQAMTEEDWQEDYTAQVHTNAVVATDKFKAVQKSILWFAAGLSAVILSYGIALVGF